MNRQEALKAVAEKARQQREQEAKEDLEFYQKITTGTQWTIFKAIAYFCIVIAVITTIEVLVDGPTKNISENEWRIDRNWEYTSHKVLDVQGFMFTPHISDWYGFEEKSIKLTYSPIFRTGKKLSYLLDPHGDGTRSHTEIRRRSIFTWFPTFQLFLLIPLATVILKRQSPWFNFARIFSLVFVFPGTLIIIFSTMV